VSEPLAGVPQGDPPSREQGQRVLDLLKVMHRLRGPGGCPWDAEQTHASLGRHLLEETYETLDAIDRGDPDALREELGDLLLQVVFHAEMAMQEGAWDVDDVAEGITAKLIRRHPHVFGDVKVGSAAEVLVNWERIKTAEKGEHDLEHDIPDALPALARAAKVQRRAAGVGFDWRTADAALVKVREELDEVEHASPEDVEDELGDVLFAVASLARRYDVDPETALRRATTRFAERFDRMKARAASEGVELSRLDEGELLARFRAAR
jgi:tetrapyrrole methylase family protein / MazG family protein